MVIKVKTGERSLAITRRQAIKGVTAIAGVSLLDVAGAKAAVQTSIPFQSASEQIAAIRRKEVSALELLEIYLDRVERLNGKINAVVALNSGTARERARRADRALARGKIWGPLHGLPITVKDTIEVIGMPNTWGAVEFRNFWPPTNATTVQRLINAGAIVFGKTNVPLFGNDIQSYNKVYGTTNNPWDISRTPGGSSGGSAAALAAGLTGLELGSDIGGSIRTPAHFCGVYGHKPSFRVVPREFSLPGIVDMDLVVFGPMARSARDLELALQILAGPDKQESTAWQLELPAPRRDKLQDYKVAAWLDDNTFPTDHETLLVMNRAVGALREAGVIVDTEARPVNISYSHETYMKLLAAAYAPTITSREFSQWIRDDGLLSKLEDGYGKRFIEDATQRHRSWLLADHARRKIKTRWANFFKQFDVLLCPITQTAAFPHNQVGEPYERTISINGEAHPYLDQMVWAGLSTMPYLPATAAPVGLTTSGLPVGIQIIGPYLEDRTTIDFARLLAGVIGGFAPPPDYV
ncbi:MAG: hypothetical protein CMM54_06850 [Rhodospirillaceae bacterium]|nr:hypothetical protein [Rhodospirillaceae bacterium]